MPGSSIPGRHVAHGHVHRRGDAGIAVNDKLNGRIPMVHKDSSVGANTCPGDMLRCGDSAQCDAV
jgi:hypothetical protein